MFTLGDALLKLAATSTREFVMCAPFAKSHVVARVLDVLPAGVAPMLYTRWRPEEVAAGVSDTDVLELVRSHNGTVYLYDRLHAKYFRNEKNVLIGSANLTAKALGWAPEANLELLVSTDFGCVSRIEEFLTDESVEATDEFAIQVNTIAASLPSQINSYDSLEPPSPGGYWIPKFRFPSDLFGAYSHGVERLSRESGLAAKSDLAALDLPAGLNRDQFEAVVGSRLRQQPLIRTIDDFVQSPRRFGQVRDRISELTGMSRAEATIAWQTTMRWMLEYLPERYVRTVSRHSEIFVRSEVHQ